MRPSSTPPSAVINPLEDHLGYQLRRASALVMATLAEQLAEIRLTIVESSILVLIDRNPGIFQSEIGRTLGIKRANVTPMITSLERVALISRKSAEGRSIGLVVTENGKKLAGEAGRIMRANEAHMFRNLSREAQENILGALKSLTNHFSDI